MPALWAFRYYARGEGASDVKETYDDGSKQLKARFLSRIRNLSVLPIEEWHETYWKRLHGECDGLEEIRFKANGVQQRPLGFRSGPNEFTMLFWATEKSGKFVPRSACAKALERKREILEGRSREAMPFGLSSSEQFLEQLADKEFRDEFVADQVRSRIALLIRTLREQRGMLQSELGARMGKLQSVVSRLEDPEYGKESLQTLLEIAAAFDLPLIVDIPEWEDWLDRTRRITKSELHRTSFDLHLFRQQAQANLQALQDGKVHQIGSPPPKSAESIPIESKKVDGTEIRVSVDYAA